MSLKLGTTDISGVPTTLINNVNNKADVSDVIYTRFDGQWVSNNVVLSTSTAKGTYTIDVSSYLPNDNYNYELLVNATVYRSGSGSCRIFITDLISQTTGNAAFRIGAVASEASSYNQVHVFVGSSRTFQIIIADNAASSANFGMIGYRRIGTNV